MTHAPQDPGANVTTQLADPVSGTGRAVVVGGGISGLVATRELLRAGWSVTLMEASGHLGGCVSTQHLTVPARRDAPEQHLELDAGAESFAVRVPAVPDLVAELGLAEQVQAPNPAGSWLYLPQGAVPAPRVGILGIPGDLDAPEVEQAIGAEALKRARQDLSDPVDRWRTAVQEGTPVTVGELVRDRLGEGVLNTLVAPVVAGVHSADPETLDIRTVAPRLLETLVEHGSLSRAVAAQRAAAPPGAAVASLAGGLHTLTDALAQQIHDGGAHLMLDTRVARVGQMEDGWQVETRGGDDSSVLRADRLVVATDGPAAWDLLAPVSGGVLAAQDRPAEGSGVALVTLVVDHPDLDEAPRGTGLLVAPSVDARTVAAKAMTHSSSKWEWAREALTSDGTHPHRHVVRLSYGRVTDAPDSTALGYRSSDEELIAAAMADAAVLTGLTGPEGANPSGDLNPHRSGDRVPPPVPSIGEPGHPVAVADVVRWRSALPVATPGHREKVTAIRQWVDATPGLDAVGAWLAGTGLAAVVADTRRRMASCD